MKRRAIFLDRDGVLNNIVLREGKPFPPASVEDMDIMPGVSQALLALAPHCLLIVVTNQPDVARGITSMRRVCDMNHHLMEHLPLDDIYVCFHDDKDNCACRKPRPGLLQQAQAHYDIDMSNSIMIGDRWKDIAAGAALGIKTVWIDQQYHEPHPTSYDYRAHSLIDALPWIKSQLNI